MSTSAKFQIVVPQKDQSGVLLSEKVYYVTLVAEGANCDASEIQVSQVTDTQFEEGDTVVLPSSGVLPPQDPPTAVRLVAA